MPLWVQGTIRVEMGFEADIALLATLFPREFASYRSQGEPFLSGLVVARTGVRFATTEGLRRTGEDQREVDFPWSTASATELEERLT